MSTLKSPYAEVLPNPSFMGINCNQCKKPYFDESYAKCLQTSDPLYWCALKDNKPAKIPPEIPIGGSMQVMHFCSAGCSHEFFKQFY